MKKRSSISKTLGAKLRTIKNWKKEKKKTSQILEIEWSWFIFQIKSKGISLRKWWKAQIVSSSPLTFLLPSPQPLTDTLVPEAPWFLLDKHVWWLSDWHSLNETRHTQIYLELSFAFKPFSFCGVASNFSFFLRWFSSRTQESSGMGARVWSPHGYFLRSDRRAQSTFWCFIWRKQDRWKDGKEGTIGRKNGKKKEKKEGKEGDDLFVRFPPELKTSCLMSL